MNQPFGPVKAREAEHESIVDFRREPLDRGPEVVRARAEQVEEEAARVEAKEAEALGLGCRVPLLHFIEDFARGAKASLLGKDLGRIGANADQGRGVAELRGNGLRLLEDGQGLPESPGEVVSQAQVIEEKRRVGAGFTLLRQLEAILEEDDGAVELQPPNVDLPQDPVQVDGALERELTRFRRASLPDEESSLGVLERKVGFPPEMMEQRQLGSSSKRLHRIRRLCFRAHA